MRAHFQAVHLSREFAVTVVSETGVYQVVEGSFTRLTATTVLERRSLEAYLKSIIAGTHYAYEKFNCKSWKIPDLNHYGHVILHYPALLHLLTEVPRLTSTIILDTHNNEREYFESISLQSKNPFKRMAMRKQADIAERLIVTSSNLLAATISVSESDRDWVVRFCRKSMPHFVVPNNLFHYAPTRWSSRKAVLYVGTLNGSMNLQALDWFRKNVWQHVRRELREVEFVVAGRNPSDRLVDDLKREGISVMPNPESLDALYCDAMYSVIPATSGSGGKIKVCEALARGVPVLTTSHGLVGQPEAIKSCCTMTDSPTEWIAAIEAQRRCESRSSVAWDKRVRNALKASYFGTSISQVAEFIRAKQ